MPKVFSLLLKVVALRAPPRILLYALRSKLDRYLKTGNRRFEFDRRYLEYSDPWHYRTSEYEHMKYGKTLSSALAWRRSSANALEIGCSLGVFTKSISPHFSRVTAIDVSKEAISSAKKFNTPTENITFIVGDIRSMKFFNSFDVVFCAEVLYYIPQRDADLVREQLHRIVAPHGIILIVTSKEKPKHSFFYFDAWEEALAPTFHLISKEVVEDPIRPYEITILAKT